MGAGAGSSFGAPAPDGLSSEDQAERSAAQEEHRASLLRHLKADSTLLAERDSLLQRLRAGVMQKSPLDAENRARTSERRRRHSRSEEYQRRKGGSNQKKRTVQKRGGGKGAAKKSKRPAKCARIVAASARHLRDTTPLQTAPDMALVGFRFSDDRAMYEVGHLCNPDDQSDKKRMRGDISLLKNKYQWACFKVSTRRFRQSAYEQRWLVGQRDGTGLPSSSEEDEEEKEEEVGSAADDEGSDSSFEVGK